MSLGSYTGLGVSLLCLHVQLKVLDLELNHIKSIPQKLKDYARDGNLELHVSVPLPSKAVGKREKKPAPKKIPAKTTAKSRSQKATTKRKREPESPSRQGPTKRKRK